MPRQISGFAPTGLFEACRDRFAVTWNDWECYYAEGEEAVFRLEKHSPTAAPRGSQDIFTSMGKLFHAVVAKIGDR
jgi:hypothetical protein